VVQKLVLIALAGAAGAVARYLLGGLVHRLFGAGFPWGTLAVNVVGCFLFGLVWALGEERMLFGSEARLIVLVGFMGAFTTFSTFAFETTEMLRNAEWLAAAGNLVGQNAAGLGAVVLGFAAAKVL